MPRTPLVAPTDYFRQRDRPSLARAAGIVCLEAVAIGAALWLFMNRVLSRMDISAPARSGVQSTVTGALVGVVLAVFVGWLLLAAFFHLFVWFSGDNRGFGTTLAVVGEAELAGVVTLPLTTAGLLVLAGQTPPDPQAAAEFFQRAASFSSPLLMLASFVTTCWKAAIQGFGLAESHGIDAGKALALTVVVGLIGFLLDLA